MFGFLGLDIQASYVVDVLLNRVSLPEKEERLQNASKWQGREDNECKQNRNSFIYYTLSYVKDLLTNSYPDVDLDSATATLLQGRENKYKNIITYRDHNVFTSHLTGTQASKNVVPWINADHIPDK